MNTFFKFLNFFFYEHMVSLNFLLFNMFMQASTLTQNVTCSVGPVTPRIYGPANLLLVLQTFLKHNKKKKMHKIHRQHLFIYFLCLFQKHLRTFMRECPQMFKALLFMACRSLLLAQSRFFGIFTGLGPAVHSKCRALLWYAPLS